MCKCADVRIAMETDFLQEGGDVQMRRYADVQMS
jgi:hypothetical protein